MATDDADIDTGLFAEFLDDFFAECDEHLVAVRRALLALEAEIGQARVNRDLLDELFRGFHSLKGLAGMVGVAEIEQLAHQLEGYLRALRQEQQRLSAEGFEALVAGTQLIEQVVVARRTQATPPTIERTLARLTTLVTEQISPTPLATAPKTPSRPATSNPDEDAKISAAHNRGDHVWLVTFSPTPQLAKRDVNVNHVRERLQGIGELIHAAPRILPGGGIAFDFVVASKADETTLAAWHDDGLTYASYQPATSAEPAHKSAVSPSPNKVTAASNMVRVDLDRLDELMQLVGTLVVSRSRLADQLTHLETLLPVAEWRNLQEVTLGFERQLRDLRASVMRIRMVPISDAFARMQFVVRDLARDLHKQVMLDLRGQDTEIDKFIVERMLDPLIHLVRNAVSHGLETPDERRAAGKSSAGTLALRAATTGDLVTLEISDDGRGIEAELIAARARALGLIEGNAPLDQNQLLQVLCAPGFSTREQADRVSGRGIGMDVVLKTVQELGGTLSLTTEAGKGTCFTLQLPLTLAILDALLVTAGDQTFAVPLSVIREIIPVQTSQIKAIERNELVAYRGSTLPLVRLTRQFRLAETVADSQFAFVVGSERNAVGIVVDRLLGKREIVVRPINDPLVDVAGIAAATELGDGRVVLILDTTALVHANGAHKK